MKASEVESKTVLDTNRCMKKHLLGPWTAIDTNKIVQWGTGEPIATVLMVNGGISEANVKLIAAAPEMLAALEYAMYEMINCYWGEDNISAGQLSALQKVKRAIAEATGEPI